MLSTSRQLCSSESPLPLEEVLDELYHSLSVDLSNTAGRIDKQTTRKRIWRRYKDKTKVKYHENYSLSFGTVTMIRLIIIIIFGTTNVVVHKSITFGAGIVVGSLIGIGFVCCSGFISTLVGYLKPNPFL